MTDDTSRAGEPTLTVSTTLAHRSRAVWALLTDVQAAARCVPRAELGRRSEDGAYPARIRLAIGPLGRSFEGRVKVLDADQDTRTLRLGLADSGSEVDATAPVRVTFQVEPSATGSVMHAHLWLPSQAGLLGGTLGTDIARALLARFGERLDAAIADTPQH